MIELVRKRHEGEGWQVFSELANGTGWNVKGWADAAALGIWPSHGYEFHGYEFKISREDLKKELRDPAKADNVGKYCDHWWLVVAEEKLLDGLVVPKTWGVLVPQKRGSSTVLRVIEKAPKLTAKPFDRAFCAAMIRNVTKTWVPKHKHDEVKTAAKEVARAELEQERTWKVASAERDLANLKRAVEKFEAASGVKVESNSDWMNGLIGEAVKRVLQLQDEIGRADIGKSIAMLERTAAQHKNASDEADHSAKVLRGLLSEASEVR